MAGDARVPGLLTRAAFAVIAGVACAGAACDRADPRPPSPAPSRPSAASAALPEIAAGSPDDAAATALGSAAWARIRWPGGDVIESHQLARLDEPVHAGSLFKLFAARAAIEQGVITPDTRVACPRRVQTYGRRVDCVHPDLGRPIGLEEALAQSCNNFFVRLAERLDRHGLAATLRRLSGGDVGSVGDAPLPLVVLGLEGPRLGMRTWMRGALEAMAGDAAADGPLSSIRRGAAQSASGGTAAALGEPFVLTYAKTGTTIAAAGVQEGLVVAWRPELEEAIAVRVHGASGRDAARVAAAAWARAAARAEPTVRVGRLRDAPSTTGAIGIEDVPLEEYVAGVVAAEGERAMPAVALQALAVAVRSYARAPDGRHARDGFDVCDTTHCQVQGRPVAWNRAAARATRGVVLWHDGRIVAVPYSASCGGVLVSPRDLWGGTMPVPTVVGRDPVPHDVVAWTSEVPADRLLAALREAGHRGDVLRDVRVAGRTRDGVPTRVVVDGLVPAELDATTFRHVVGRRLGWELLKSHVWEITRSGRGYRFAGRGKGHGAGVCLRGASVLAAQGRSLGQVLSAYVPGARLASTQDRLTLRVPSALVPATAELRWDALALLADLRQQLRVAAPRDTAVEVHPTREAYQRATGRAWWTSASTRRLGPGRYRIDMAVPAGRQAREQVLSTLRHEFVHVLTESALSDAPAWAAEGLAGAASRGRAEVSAFAAMPGAACPDDMAVTRPGRLDVMRDVYARAAACVVRVLPDGLAGWRALAAH